MTHGSALVRHWFGTFTRPSPPDMRFGSGSAAVRHSPAPPSTGSALIRHSFGTGSRFGTFKGGIPLRGTGSYAKPHPPSPRSGTGSALTMSVTDDHPTRWRRARGGLPSDGLAMADSKRVVV
jgi:hypothetical protein